MKKKLEKKSEKKKKLKSPHIKPTIKQKKALEILMTGNKGGMGEVMAAAGYSPTVIKNPGKVTETRSWQELLETYLPDGDLARIHNELLNKKENIIVKDRFGGVEIIPTGQVDTQAAKAALEMAYKLKGKNKEDNNQKQPIININIERSEQIKKALEDL
jgi:hypothetical protein